MSYIRNKELQKQLREWVGYIGADYLVTVTFNNDATLFTATKALSKWHARIDAKLLGKHWASHPHNDRLFFFAMAEKIQTNLHWHMAVKLADEKRAGVFEGVAERCWLSIVPSGTLGIEKIDTITDARRIQSYIAKEQWKARNFNAFVISDDFVGNNAA